MRQFDIIYCGISTLALQARTNHQDKTFTKPLLVQIDTLWTNIITISGDSGKDAKI